MAIRLNESEGLVFLNGIFKKYYPALCYIAQRITGDGIAAEDIAQESFLKWWHIKQKGREILNDKSYLYSCVRNQALLWLRNQKRSEAEIQNLQQIYSSGNDNRLQELVRVEMAAEMYRAIKDLPTQCRNVVRLILEEGKDIKEVASILNLSPNAVSKQRTRGITLLRKKLTILNLIPLFFSLVCP
jgi:RNA polymerase sigma-70 factor (family 1)